MSVGSVLYQESLPLHLLSLHLADSPIRSAHSASQPKKLPATNTAPAPPAPPEGFPDCTLSAVLCVMTQADGDNLRLMVFTLLPGSSRIGEVPAGGFT